MPQIIEVQKTFGEPQLVALAREIAMDIQPIEVILKQFSLSPSELENITKLPRFQQLLEEHCLVWQSAMNGADRIKAKSAAVIEDFLPELYNRLHDGKENLLHKIKGAELLAKLAGLGIEKQMGASGPGFHLEIHIGDGKPTLVNVTPKVSVPLIDAEAEEDASE